MYVKMLKQKKKCVNITRYIIKYAEKSTLKVLFSTLFAREMHIEVH